MTTTDNYETTFSDNDPTFEEPSSATRINPGSPLDVLKEALAKDVENEDLELNVPGRPVLRLVFNTNIDGEKFQLWQRRSVVRKGSQDIDALRFCSIVIANQCKGVLVNNGKEWREARGEDGEVLNFQHSEFRNMLSGGKPINVGSELVRKLYGNDGVLIQSAREIIEAAGYGDDAADILGTGDTPTQG